MNPAGGTNQIRVLLAEDQAMVLGALAALLELETDIAVVARAGNGRARRSLRGGMILSQPMAPNGFGAHPARA